MGGLGGLFGLVVLVADIWAILNVFESRTSTTGKVLWTYEGTRLLPGSIAIGGGKVFLLDFNLTEAQRARGIRERLPQYAANFWAANAWDWMPPRKFRYVYTLHDCVPEHLLGEYLRRLLARCVEDEGTLIVGAYGSHSRQEPARDVAADLREHGFTVAGSASHGEFPVTRIAWTRR